MKKLLVFLAVLIALVAGAVVALPRLVPMERIEQEVKTRFEDATGRQLKYGSVRVYVWPNVGLRLKEVTVSNPGWASEPTMLALGEMDVSLSGRALLDKKVDIRKFILKKPVIHLEKAKDGRVSWELKPTKEVKDAVDAPADTQSTKASAFDVSFGEVSISDGQVAYRDAATGKTETISDVDMTMVMPNLQAALNIDGAMTFRGRRVTTVLSVDRPFDLANGKVSPGSLNLSSDMIKAEVAGDLSTTGTFLKGRVNADISSLPTLVAWLGEKAETQMPVHSFSVASTTEISGDGAKLTGATVSLDDMKGAGDLSVSTAGARPMVRARLSLDHVNLDKFIASGAEAKGAGTADPKGMQDAGWDDTPIDFSALKAADADVVVETKGFTVKGVEVGASTLTAKLNAGALSFTSSAAAIFGGTAGTAIGLNAAGATPSLTAKISLKSVEAKPVLSTFAGFDKLSGKTDADIDVAAAGRSQKAMIGSLSGDGKVMFRNGALEGIDIVNLAKAIQSRLGEMGVGAGKTEFVDLGGTFTIAKGIVHNEDLKLRGPLVQATGSGDINLPAKSLKYRVIPVLTASSAVENAGGIKVPVDITGPFSDIKIRPDYAAVLQDALKNPEDLKKTLKQAEDSIEPLKDNIKNLRKDIKNDPAKAIEGLLGGGLGGLMAPKPAPAPAPAPVEAAPAAPAPAEPEAATP